MYDLLSNGGDDYHPTQQDSKMYDVFNVWFSCQNTIGRILMGAVSVLIGYLGQTCLLCSRCHGFGRVVKSLRVSG